MGLKEQVAAELEKAAAAAEDGGASAMQIAKEAEAAERVTTPFQFLHIGILREYLHKEFAAADFGETGFELERVRLGLGLGLGLGVGFELERVIDDFVQPQPQP